MKHLQHLRCPECGKRCVYAEDAERQCWRCGHAWTDEDYEPPRKQLEEEEEDD